MIADSTNNFKGKIVPCDSKTKVKILNITKRYVFEYIRFLKIFLILR